MAFASFRSILAVSILIFISGCAVYPCCSGPQLVAAGPGAAVFSPSKLTAVGYGSPANYQQYTAGQAKLMAIRAAQLDAYRQLAEQVHGFRVWGSTAVSAFAAQNDTIRSHVDAFIRGARVINTTAIADGNYEVTVELEITQTFADCFTPYGRCGFRAVVPTCAVPGCTATSVGYVSY